MSLRPNRPDAENDISSASASISGLGSVFNPVFFKCFLSDEQLSMNPSEEPKKVLSKDFDENPFFNQSVTGCSEKKLERGGHVEDPFE